MIDESEAYLSGKLNLFEWMIYPVTLEDFFTAAPSLKPVDPDQVAPGHFHRGLLLSADPESGLARVDLGGVEGLVDGASVERLATTLKRARNGNSWARPSRKERQELLVAMAFFYHAVRDRELLERLGSFSFADTKCSDPEDAALLEECVGTWYAKAGDD